MKLSGGRELSGRFASLETRLNDWRFAGMEGSLLWTRDRFEVTKTRAGFYGGRLGIDFSMKPLASLNRPVLKTVDVETKEETVSFKERTDVTAVPAMGVVAETMMALVLADEATRKFGGDSLAELVRNRDAFVASLG